LFMAAFFGFGFGGRGGEAPRTLNPERSEGL